MQDADDRKRTLIGEPRVMLSAGGVVTVLFVTTLAMILGVLLAIHYGKAADSPQVVRVSLGADGFTPEVVEVQEGKPVELQVFRKDAVPCSDSVVLEGLNISQALMPHKATMMAFTPRHPGDYTLRCGMGCWKATLKVREMDVDDSRPTHE